MIKMKMKIKMMKKNTPGAYINHMLVSDGAWYVRQLICICKELLAEVPAKKTLKSGYCRGSYGLI